MECKDLPRWLLRMLPSRLPSRTPSRQTPLLLQDPEREPLRLWRMPPPLQRPLRVLLWVARRMPLPLHGPRRDQLRAWWMPARMLTCSTQMSTSRFSMHQIDNNEGLLLYKMPNYDCIMDIIALFMWITWASKNLVPGDTPLCLITGCNAPFNVSPPLLSINIF